LANGNGDPRLCDCNRIVDAEAVPVAPDQPNKEKDISLKADWKYIGVVSYRFSNNTSAVQKTITATDLSFVSQQFLRSVFHPPQA